MKMFKKVLVTYSKLVTSCKWYLRLLLTAVTAFILVYCTGIAAYTIRNIAAYHCWSCLIVTCVAINALLSKNKLSRIWKKLSALDDRPAPVRKSASEIAAEFAAAVNGEGEGEEAFED